MEPVSNPRASTVRLGALAGAVALAVALPLVAAVAGPATPGARGGHKAGGRGGASAERPAASSGSAPGAGLLPGLGLAHAAERLRRTAACGPELSAPEGVEAQTCVLAERGESWARTYYRNETGRTLRAVLTLMHPDGRTVQVNCVLEAQGEPGACETPRAPGGASVVERALYGAVAEIASADSDRLLLRSGSNPASPAAS